MSDLSKRVLLQSSPVVILLLVSSLCVFLLAGCGSSEPEVTTSSASTATETAAAGGGEPVLEVVGPEGTRAYTLDEIKAMKSTEGYGGMKSSTGHITPPTLVKGVLIEDLFAEVGGYAGRHGRERGCQGWLRDDHLRRAADERRLSHL